MRTSPIQRVAGLLACLFARGIAHASAYHAQAKLPLVIVVDRFRGDSLESYHDQFGEGGLRMFLDRSKLFKGYSPEGGWYLTAVPIPYGPGSTSRHDHASPYSCETHVLAFYGLIHPGTDCGHAERVDLAVTPTLLPAINAPNNRTGRVPSSAVERTEAPLHLGDEKGPGGSKNFETASRKLPQGDN